MIQKVFLICKSLFMEINQYSDEQWAVLTTTLHGAKKFFTEGTIISLYVLVQMN